METLNSAPLTLADRCDQCSAQAMVRLSRSADRVLDLCAHHYHQHSAKLNQDRFTVTEDVRHVLLRK